MNKYNPYGDCQEFREALGKIIGIPLDDLEERASLGILSDEDLEASERLQRLILEVIAASGQCYKIVVLCNHISRDAMVCCLSVPPTTPAEDATQRIMRHILEIKRIAAELE